MDERYYALALKYLQRRPRSEKEMVDYLAKKKASEESISMILRNLRKEKFINDKEFVTWWIDQRTRFKPKGRMLISLELQQKGISKEIINSVYEESNEEIISDVEKAITFLKKKKGKFDTLSRQEQYNKAGAFLSRRGFGMDAIVKSIDEVFGK